MDSPHKGLVNEKLWLNKLLNKQSICLWFETPRCSCDHYNVPWNIHMSLWCLMLWLYTSSWCWNHDDIIKWKLFPRCWPFVWGMHRSLVDSPHKGQWRGALMYAWTNGRANSPDETPWRSLWRYCNDHVIYFHKVTLKGMGKVNPYQTKNNTQQNINGVWDSCGVLFK